MSKHEEQHFSDEHHEHSFTINSVDSPGLYGVRGAHPHHDSPYSQAREDEHSEEIEIEIGQHHHHHHDIPVSPIQVHSPHSPSGYSSAGNSSTGMTPMIKKSNLKKVSKYGEEVPQQMVTNRFSSSSFSDGAGDGSSTARSDSFSNDEERYARPITRQNNRTDKTDVANQRDLDEFEKEEKIDWGKYINYGIYGSLGVIIFCLLFGFSMYFIVTEILLKKEAVPKPANMVCGTFTGYNIESNLNPNGQGIWNASLLLNIPGDYIFSRYETSSVTYLDYFSYAKQGLCNEYPSLDKYCTVNSPELFKFKVFYSHGSTKYSKYPLIISANIIDYALEIGKNATLIGVEKNDKFFVYSCIGDEEIGSLKQIDKAITTSADPSNSDFVIFSANETQVLALVVDRYIYLPKSAHDVTPKYINFVYESPKFGSIYPGERVAYIERHKIGTTLKRYWYAVKILQPTNMALFSLYHFMIPYYYTLSIQ